MELLRKILLPKMLQIVLKEVSEYIKPLQKYVYEPNDADKRIDKLEKRIKKLEKLMKGKSDGK